MKAFILVATALVSIARAEENFSYFQQGYDWPDTCLTGLSQSPVNIREVPENPLDYMIVTAANSSYLPLELQYPVETEYYNVPEENTYRVKGLQGSFSGVTVGGTEALTFVIDNIHFHTPSEHIIDGEAFPMEMHMVHRAATGEQAVLGVWFSRSETRSALLDAIIADTPLDINRELGTLVEDFYFYSGSLTTPPCTEGVNWFIPRLGYRNSLPATPDQIDFFAERWVNDPNFANGHGNNRPIQLLNSRTVYRFLPSERDLVSFLPI